MKKVTLITLGTLSLMLAGSLNAAEPTMEKRLSFWDANKDGSVSLREMQARRVKMAEAFAEKQNLSKDQLDKNIIRVKKEAGNILKKHDKDGSGSLSLQEFTTWFESK